MFEKPKTLCILSKLSAVRLTLIVYEKKWRESD